MLRQDALEKRQFQRIFYREEALLFCDDFQLRCKVLDLSLKGCLLDFQIPWPGNHEKTYTLVIQLSELQTISMALKFAHGHGTQVGFRIEFIDIDSITNLRRLVELNLGDSVMLERDLQALVS